MPDSAFLVGVRQIVGSLEDVIRGGPDAARLAAASWIHDWTPVTRGRDIPSLYGRVADDANPDAPGREMATADLLHLDPERGLARTREGWLRLGARADAMRRVPKRRQVGDGTGLGEHLLRNMGEQLWPVQDPSLDDMLEAWPADLLEGLAMQEGQEPTDPMRRLAAMVWAGHP